MTINCKTVGEVPMPLGSGDEFMVSFDISEWLDTDEITTCQYTAVDENGDDMTDTVLDGTKNSNTTTLMKPYLKGGGQNKKSYTVKCLPTTVNGYKKAFYIKFKVRDIGE